MGTVVFTFEERRFKVEKNCIFQCYISFFNGDGGFLNIEAEPRWEMGLPWPPQYFNKYVIYLYYLCIYELKIEMAKRLKNGLQLDVTTGSRLRPFYYFY